MKKIIMILLAMLVVFTASACNGATAKKETDSTMNVQGTFIETEEATEVTNYDKVKAYMEGECRKAFSPYYELLDFQITDYQEEVVNGNIESIFLYRLIHKNYTKDPDTVPYIKEAKESGNKHYQQMYDEYLKPQEMNFHFKTIIDEKDLITLYSNISPQGIQWEETKMTDFIIK